MNPIVQQSLLNEDWAPFEPVEWVVLQQPVTGSAARQDLLHEGLEVVPKTFGEVHIRSRKDVHRAKIVPRGHNH